MHARFRSILLASLILFAPVIARADVSPAANPVPAVAPAATTSGTPVATPTDSGSATSPAPAPAPSVSTPAPSGPAAVFDVSPVRWNEFDFKAYAPDEPGYLFAWDFGDGVTSTYQETTHSFLKWGSYTVTLVVTDPVGHTATSSSVVRVSFFNPQSPFTVAVVGVIAIAFIFALVILFRLTRRPRRPLVFPDNNKDDEDEPDET